MPTCPSTRSAGPRPRHAALLLAALLGLGCGGASGTASSERRGGERVAQDRIDGSEGAICEWGEERGPDTPDQTLAPCGEGLHCCYPCGIQGCDSVCATQEQCLSYAELP